MSMKSALVSVVAAAWLVTASAAVGQQCTQPCVGDCNGDCSVAINELITGVNIALGSQPVSMCPSFDCQGTGSVPINCLIQGVNNALNGCPGGPTSTPTTTSPPTATPTATPTGGGKERVYFIDPGVLLADPSGTKSGLFTSGLGGANAASAFPLGPLTLVLDVPGPDGVASFTLKENATLDVAIVDGSRFCLKLDAASSRGSIDCDGETPYDIAAERPSLAPGIAYTFQTGLGPPADPGDGNIIITGLLEIVPVGTSTPCDDVTYTNPPQDFAFTTTKGTATIPGTGLLLENEGEPFDCTNFETPNSGGMLTAPIPANQAPIGDVVNAMRFGELMQ